MEAQRISADRPPTISPTTWKIEPHYTTVEFSAKSLLFFTVKGTFTDFDGMITLDENDISRSSVEATIRASSVNTGIKRRDAHLRSADFLDADRHPEIRFQSSSVARGRDRDTLRITGTLTIRGQSREIPLDVMEADRSRSPQGDEVSYYTVPAKIDRFAFGINYTRLLVGRTLKVTIQVQASKQR